MFWGSCWVGGGGVGGCRLGEGEVEKELGEGVAG